MDIRQHFESHASIPIALATAQSPNRVTAVRLESIKSQIHREILAQVDLRRMETISPEALRQELKGLTQRLLDESGLAINEAERRQIVQGIQDEMLGLGPIEPLLADPTVSDILVNGPHSVYVERKGKIESTNIEFDSEAHLMRVIDRIVSRIGRRVDEMNPMVDARLPDGSRVNAVIPPLAIDGPLLSIRRFSVVPYTMMDLLAFHTLNAEMSELINGLVKAKINLLVSGGTGSGKTTF